MNNTLLKRGDTGSYWLYKQGEFWSGGGWGFFLSHFRKKLQMIAAARNARSKQCGQQQPNGHRQLLVSSRLHAFQLTPTREESICFPFISSRKNVGRDARGSQKKRERSLHFIFPFLTLITPINSPLPRSQQAKISKALPPPQE